MRRVWVLCLSIACFIAAAIVCASLQGCTPAADPLRHLGYTHHSRAMVNTLDIPVWLDDRVPERMRPSVASALDQWNVVLNGHYRYVVYAPEDGGAATLEWRIAHQATMLVIKAAAVRDDDYPDDGVLGWVDTTQPNVLHILVDGLNVSDEAMVTVLMHEIGHTLGLEHTKQRGLLFPYYTDQPTCIDHLTVEELAASHEWDDRSLNWCD